MGNLIDDLVRVAEREQRVPEILHVARPVKVEAESTNWRLGMEWISVDDKAPMHNMVLGWNGDFEFCMSIGGELKVYLNGGWVKPDSPITHWMPLPEPPNR